MSTPDVGAPGDPIDPQPGLPAQNVPPESVTPTRVIPAASPADHALARPSAPSGAGAPDFLELLRALQRRWLLAVVAGLTCAAIVAAITWFVVPPAHYTSRAVLRIMMYQPKVVFQTEELHADYRVFQRTQAELITNRNVLEAVLADPKVAGLETVKEAIQRTDPVEWLGQQVRVDFSPSSELVAVSMSGNRPKDLQILVDAVVNKYLENIVNTEKEERHERVQNLKTLWDDYQKKMKEKRDQLRKLALQAGSGDQPTLAYKNQIASQQLAMAEQERMRVHAELVRAKARAAAVKVARPAEIDLSAVEDAIAKDPEVIQLESTIASLAKQHQGVSRIPRDRYDPALLRFEREIESTRKALEDRRAWLRPRLTEQLRKMSSSGGPSSAAESMDREIEILEHFENELGSEIEESKKRLSTLTENTLDLQSEQDQISLLADTAQRVGTEVKRMEVEIDAPDRIKVVASANEPKTKDELKQAKISGVAAIAALACVLFGISFWEYRARRINSVHQVINDVGLRLVGALPALPDQTRRRLMASSGNPEHDWQSLMVESVDSTRAMLLHASRVESLRIVMVTSALAGEGKTSLSGHLAASLARAGLQTLLVDGDLRRPAVHRLFDLTPDLGLCEVLRGEATISEVIRPTQAAGLNVVLAGQVDSQAIQALARGDLETIFAQFQREYDFVVVDSPPVLPVADALLVGQHVDAVLFSILRDVSRIPMVRTAHERLSTLGIRVLGAVVAGTHDPTYSHSYAYSYRSGTGV